MSSRVHKLFCDEYHVHTAPRCCSVDCWCIKARKKTASHHRVTIKQQLGLKVIRYQAECSCGWKSRRRMTSSGAVTETAWHRRRYVS